MPRSLPLTLLLALILPGSFDAFSVLRSVSARNDRIRCVSQEAQFPSSIIINLEYGCKPTPSALSALNDGKIGRSDDWKRNSCHLPRRMAMKADSSDSSAMSLSALSALNDGNSASAIAVKDSKPPPIEYEEDNPLERVAIFLLSLALALLSARPIKALRKVGFSYSNFVATSYDFMADRTPQQMKGRLIGLLSVVIPSVVKKLFRDKYEGEHSSSSSFPSSLLL